MKDRGRFSVLKTFDKQENKKTRSPYRLGGMGSVIILRVLTKILQCDILI